MLFREAHCHPLRFQGRRGPQRRVHGPEVPRRGRLRQDPRVLRLPIIGIGPQHVRDGGEVPVDGQRHKKVQVRACRFHRGVWETVPPLSQQDGQEGNRRLVVYLEQG